MQALIPLLGKVLDPLLKMFFGARFSLAELLISNAQARKAGREAAVGEAREKTLDDVAKTQAARRAVSDDPAVVVHDKYNRDNR